MSGPICPIEERWDFLLPWCAVLKGRIKFDSLECDTNYWGDVKNYLQVNLPYRHEETTKEDEENLIQNPQLSKEETFELKFRKAREALALLSVVAHVDYMAWRFLLETYCGMDMQYEGSEKFDEKVEPKFVLFMDLEGRKSKESDALDLVKFCGVDQRIFPSQEYVRALEKIAVGTDYLMSRKDVKVPVRVNTASCMKISVSSLMAVFMDIQRAEQTVKEQWEIYKASHEKEDAALGKLRCTFVLEPMIADVTGCRISAELAEAMERLVTGNVWASQVAVGLTMVPDLENEAGLAKKVMRQLMASLFDNTRRPPELALTSYHSGFQVCSTRAAPDRLQFEKVHVQCAFSLGDMDVDALFSAIASSQTAKKFSLDIDAKKSFPSAKVSLTDASSSFTKCMRQLRVRRLNPVDFGRVLYDPSINGVMEALLQMLQKNTSLEYLQILLSTSHHKYLKEFRKYHLKPIDRLLKLPIESKVALLSVMSSKYPASTKKDLKLSSARLAFSQLNQNILAKIFAFCHSPMLRKVNAFLILDGVPQE
ncbi:hypothetical protein PRNP1_010258 [Phytophthora ramorum]